MNRNAITQLVAAVIVIACLCTVWLAVPAMPLTLFAPHKQWTAFLSKELTHPPLPCEPPDHSVPPGVKRIVIVGDIMLANWMEVLFVAKEMTAGDPLYPFAATASLLQSADICAGNLESPMLHSKRSPIYSINFSGLPKRLDRVKAAGFDLLSLANNHMLNRGKIGLAETIGHLTQMGIAYTGAGLSYEEAYAPYITTLDDGIRVGWLGFDTIDDTSPNGPDGPVMAAVKPDSSGYLQSVRAARAQVDYLIVLIHWGEEFVPVSNEAQRRLGRQLVDIGADLVVGSHPHHVQEFERYKGGLIVYSLGNFAFSLNDISDKFAAMTSGAILQCDLKEGRLYDFAFIPILEFQGEPVPLFETCTDNLLRQTRQELLAVLQGGG